MIATLWRAVVASAVLMAAANAEIIYTEKSLYRNISVFDEAGLRCMVFGRYSGGRQTCISLGNRDDLVLDYTKMMLGALYLDPRPQRLLVVGLGGGTLPRTLQRVLPTARIDIVEIDPAVVKVAMTYFDFAPAAQTRVIESDARVFVKRALRDGTRYDLVMLDAFDHDYIPEHLLTREFLLELRGVLSAQGVLAANTFSNSRLYLHESATYHDVFGDFYNLRRNNRVILLRRGGLPGADELAANAQLVERQLAPLGVTRQWLLPQFALDKPSADGVRVLTDQYSPSNLLNAK